jgi:hypothetical protein
LSRPGIDADRIYIVREPTKRVVVVIKATLEQFNADVLARVTEELRQWTGDVTLQITDIDEGSVRLKVSLSPAAAARLMELRASGQLTEIVDDKQTESAPRPSQFVDGIPRDLDDLCAELLERDPADRPTGPQLLRRLGVAP